jgi:hypothetical protein
MKNGKTSRNSSHYLMICVILQRYIGQNTVSFEAKQEVIQVISAPDMTQNATEFHAISSRFFYDFVYPIDSLSISR